MEPLKRNFLYISKELSELEKKNNNNNNNNNNKINQITLKNLIFSQKKVFVKKNYIS